MYRNKGNRQKNNKKGFTLVELVVILVILAILMAILVPSLVGYIRKAKNQQAFAECRSCVIAAQSIASETYGKDKSATLNWGTPTSDYTAVQTMAEVPTDSKIDTISTNTEQYLVIYLSYTTGDLTVIYERDHNPEYYLQEEPGWSVDAKKDVAGLSGYAGFVEGYEGNSPDRWTAAREWLNSLAEDGKGSLPEVSASVTEKAGYGDKKMYWRPYYLGDKKNPQVIYYANSDNMKDEDGNLRSQSGNTWNAALIMINGTLYRYSKNDKTTGTGISSIYRNASDYASASKYIEGLGFEQVK